MGQYLIPNAASINEAIDFVGEPQLTQTWQKVGNDVLFVDSALSDAECAALYVGFTPSGTPDADYVTPPPQAVRDARDTLKSFWNLNPSSLTGTQSATLIRALLTWMRWQNQNLED